MCSGIWYAGTKIRITVHAIANIIPCHKSGNSRQQGSAGLRVISMQKEVKETAWGKVYFISYMELITLQLRKETQLPKVREHLFNKHFWYNQKCRSKYLLISTNICQAKNQSAQCLEVLLPLLFHFSLPEVSVSYYLNMQCLSQSHELNTWSQASSAVQKNVESFEHRD